MDLGSIRSRVHSGQYESLEKCFSDIRLVFENAILFNGEGHFITKVAKDILEEFESEVRPLQDRCFKDYCKRHQHKCGGCKGSLCLLCGEKCLKFENSNLFCQGSNCGQKIRRNAVYFISADGASIYCQKCHASLPPILTESSNVSDEGSSSASTALKKKSLLKRKFDEEIAEPWVSCQQCGFSFHQICVLAPNQFQRLDDLNKAFTCPICMLEEGVTNITAQMKQQSWNIISPVSTPFAPLAESFDVPLSSPVPIDEIMESSEMKVDDMVLNVTPERNSWRAAELPRSALSDFLESLVKDLLERKGFPDVKESITIRLTSNLPKLMEVPRAIIDNLKGEDGRLKEVIPYKQKCIQLFQTIDGIDVSLFCLYVHEFDANAPEPNRSSVYIAYLDSVDYFRPMQMRSFVYQEIVAGYFLWAQARGFKKCLIWSCPPQRGDSFIFWCHPNHQKTPSRDRLNSWYASIISRSKALGVHNGASHLWDQYFKKFNQRDEAPSREAAKRSFVGSGKVAPRKYRKTSTGSKCDVNTTDSETEELHQPKEAEGKVALTIPPIFDGDYWVMEFLKLHRLHFQKARMIGEQNCSSNFRKCRDVLKSLISRPHAVAFRQPVDPVALCIPTYPLIVKNPMDLGTIREKLRSSGYPNILEFVQDVRLTFNNAKLFNPPGHVVHIQADLLSKEFEKAMEQSFQDEYSNTPMDKTLDEFFVLCKMSSAPSKDNTISSSSCLAVAPSQESVDLHINVNECLTPKAAVNVITPTPFKPQFHNSPKSVIEDTDDYFSQTQEKLVTRVVSEDMDVNIISPDLATLPPRCPNYSSSMEETSSDCTSLETTTMSVVYPDVSEGSQELSGRSLNVLLSDLSKAVHRLNDDLFVIAFNPIDFNVLRKSSDLSATPLICDDAIEKLQRLTPDTSDPDSTRSNPMVDSRYIFLEICQLRHYQFDSLRRAKYSSLMMLYHLQHPEDCSYRPKCSNCREYIEELRWHCEVCYDYEICRGCKDSLAKQFHESNTVKGAGSSRKTKVVEWKNDDSLHEGDGGFHPHPLTPYRVSIR